MVLTMAANRKRSGFKGTIYSGIILIIIVSFIIGWAKVNKINSIEDGYDYFRSWSDKLTACSGDWSKAFWGGCFEGGGNQSPNVPTNHNDANLGKNQALDELGAIKVADADKSDYNRSDYRHWIMTDTGCNTRVEVLKAQGVNVTTDDSNKCKIVKGDWNDPYTGQTLTDPSKIDIDHVIPLGYISNHGGSSWTSEKKQQYANDQSTVLLAVSSSENRSKGDKGPGDWFVPDNKSYQCEYSKRWVNIATKYQVSIATKDKNQIQKALQSCSS